jgi:NADP-dependent 3-hydroxy acid dehydrogenase YdfG
VASSIGEAASFYTTDLRDAAAVTSLSDRVTSEIGTPDIIVNNAGAGRWKFVEETTPAEAVDMMAVPYFAAFNVTHAFLPGMLRRNTGHIVNVSSVGSRFVWPGATAYIAARWAVRGFTQALRADLADTGIHVTLYESGVVQSEYSRGCRSGHRARNQTRAEAGSGALHDENDVLAACRRARRGAMADDAHGL